MRIFEWLTGGGWKYWGDAQVLPCPFCGEEIERVRIQATFGGVGDFMAAAASYDTSEGGKHIEQKCESCGMAFESRLAPDAAALRHGGSFHQWRKK